ncbi:HAD family hydrolase [Salipiger mangrovisoli]|uniref:HAD family phosphatase n=1 Tax=Salipiger mangrovisoli TaxID=2865933 RepID=A0ABR9X4Y7_9RHOB|nr:HAD family phosphatase [Salipiger mangrovisoli]MBE9638581.1 HAD family phosphatase [Salipiger mangrovisoli]
MTQTHAVIFDLDGCLVDSEPHSLAAIAEEMRALGIEDATPEEIGARFLGVSISVIHAHVAQRSGAPCPPDFSDNFERRLFARYEAGLHLIPGVRALLCQLRDAGIPMAIGTGGSLRRLATTLRVADLAPFFERRGFSADQVARGKPAPDLFLLAAERLGVAPEHCVVVEDSPHGVAAARAAGMRAIGFTGGSHLDGRRNAHAEILRQAGAEEVLAEMSNMYAALLGDQPQPQ